MMKYEKPQKGNPHELTIKQHVFPVYSIKRFLNNNNLVELMSKFSKKIIPCIPTDQIFCAIRCWDQRAEDGYMQSIEAKFQNLADNIIDNKIICIRPEEKEVVDDFYGLWNIREQFRNQPIKDQKIKGITDVVSKFTVDEQEVLEKNHITFVKPNLTFSGRDLTGGQIQLRLFAARKQLANTAWGILRAMKGEFIVPDNFFNAHIVPLNPTICLYSEGPNRVIFESDIRKINKLAIESSRNYFFARDLSKCFIKESDIFSAFDDNK